MTPISKKQKADDYLQELALSSPEEWLASLIERVLLLRSVPDEIFLDDIYRQLLIKYGLGKNKLGRAVQTQRQSLPRKAPAIKGFVLKSLKHVSGVNALENDTTIPFHAKLTVLYGKNASGKSGFVRILKRMAGSRTQEEVWQNVHSSRSKNNCRAQVEYTVGKKDNTHMWRGEMKVAPFDHMAIFDGRCIPIYLNKSLDFSYQPYGFDLFQTLAVSLQKLQERLGADIEREQDERIPIGDVFNRKTSVGRFIAAITSATAPEEVEKLPAWGSVQQKALAEKSKQRKELQTLDQRNELLGARHQRLRVLEAIVLRIQSELSEQNIKVYSALIKKFNLIKKEQSEKKGKALQDYDIAKRESDEWEEFISAGEDYIRIAQHEHYPGNDDNCVYCQQGLSRTAQELLQLYRKLFQEKGSSSLEIVEAEIEKALAVLKRSSFAAGFHFTEDDFKKILPENTVQVAFLALNRADDLARKLANMLKSRKVVNLQPLKVSRLLAVIREARQKVETKIDALKSTQSNLSKKSQELDDAIVELEDIQKLPKWRPQIKKHILTEQWLARARDVLDSKLNTRPITDLGKKAWRELVSDAFKERFQRESTNLDAPGVNLEFRGEYGAQIREKKMEGLEHIDQFLSEGEQKAVALADFFAELSMQSGQAPVILDDPATSFDHDRKERIAKRIVEESESRQIVVFTHDLMFASFLHDRVKNESGSIDEEKALFHNLYSEAGRIGLVAKDYYPGSVKFDALMKEIEAKTKELVTLSGAERADGFAVVYSKLRRAVEKAIEERIFGGVITRWSDRIQMHNATPSRASLDRSKLDKAKELHEKFSRYIESHNQSDEMLQHAMPSIEDLQADVREVKDIAKRGAK